MSHHTKDKGDLGVVKAIADLTERGYIVFAPIVSEHTVFDLIAYKDSVSYRIQVKYRSDNFITNKTTWSDKNGTHTHFYNENDFDYYALYLPDINKIVYASMKYGGRTISSVLPNSAMPFYWWEDFLEIDDKEIKKRTFRDFNLTITSSNKGVSRPKSHKVNHPPKEVLAKLLWEKPTLQIAKDFGVSDNAVSKWAQLLNLEKPGRGYWSKQRSKTNP